MITLRKLKIYKKYDGDSTQYARDHYRNDDTEMSTQDWSDIESLLNDLFLLNTGKTHDSYKKTIEEKLNVVCDAPAVVEEMKRMSLKI